MPWQIELVPESRLNEADDPAADGGADSAADSAAEAVLSLQKACGTFTSSLLVESRLAEPLPVKEAYVPRTERVEKTEWHAWPRGEKDGLTHEVPAFTDVAAATGGGLFDVAFVHVDANNTAAAGAAALTRGDGAGDGDALLLSA